MNIKVGPLAFDLSHLGEYNPNYLTQLPPKVFATFGDMEITFIGLSAMLFDKCVKFYIDYKLGSRPDTPEEIDRRFAEIKSCLVN